MKIDLQLNAGPSKAGQDSGSANLDQSAVGVIMSAAAENPNAAAENNNQLEAEAFAVKAQAVHKKVEGFEARVVNLGRQQLAAAIEAGQNLIKAKEILCHGNFKKEQERWRINKTITFSDRSGRRYMLLATYAEEIKMANVATLREAERLATAWKDAADSEEAADKKAGQAGRPPAPAAAPALSAADLESQVLKAMRRFAEVDDQRALLSALIEKLNHRLELLQG